MTAVAEAPQPGTEAVSSPQSAVIGIIAGDGVQIGVLLDANAPVSVMIDPLLKVVNVRLRELGLRHWKQRSAAGGPCAWSTAHRCGLPSR